MRLQKMCMKSLSRRLLMLRLDKNAIRSFISLSRYLEELPKAPHETEQRSELHHMLHTVSRDQRNDLIVHETRRKGRILPETLPPARRVSQQRSRNLKGLQSTRDGTADGNRARDVDSGDMSSTMSSVPLGYEHGNLGGDRDTRGIATFTDCSFEGGVEHRGLESAVKRWI